MLCGAVITLYEKILTVIDHLDVYTWQNTEGWQHMEADWSNLPYNHFIRMQGREGAAAYRGCHWVKTGLHLTTIHSYNYGQCIVSNPPSCFWTVGGPASDSDLGFKPSILLLWGDSANRCTTVSSWQSFPAFSFSSLCPSETFNGLQQCPSFHAVISTKRQTFIQRTTVIRQTKQ